MIQNDRPSEPIDLPSRGWFYPTDHPLASGKLELFFMTAKEENILTSKNLIAKGIVLDRLLSALIATPSVELDSLLTGDYNAALVGIRIMGYGRKYPTSVNCPKCQAVNENIVDLQQINDKEIEFKPEQKGISEFDFTLPISNKKITFRLLTQKDEKDIDAEIESLQQKTKSDISTEVTTRMFYAITAIDGKRDRGPIRLFVESMIAQDAKAFRKYANSINPTIDLRFDFTCITCGHKDRLGVPITSQFFWPDA